MSETDLAGTGTASAEAAPRRRGGLSGMVLAELRQLATELNVPDISGMRKGDLIAAIKERQGGAAAAPAKKPKAKVEPAAATGSDGADASQLALGDTAAAPAGNGAAAPAAPSAPAEQAGDQGGQSAEKAEAPAPRTRRRRAATRPAGAPDATATDAASGTSSGNGAAPAVAESAPAAAPEQAAPAASAPAQAESTPAPAEERREDADGAGRRGRTRRRGQGDDNGQKDAGPKDAPKDTPKDTASDAGQRDAGQRDARRDADGDDTGSDGDRRRGRGADRNTERNTDRNAERGGDRNGDAREDNGRGNGANGDNGRGGRNRDGADSGRGNRGNRNNDRTGDRGDNRGDRNGDRNNDRNGDRVNDRGADRNDFRDDDGDDGDGRGRRGRRFRDRRRGRDRERTGGGAGGGVDTEIRDDDVLLPVAGIVDILDNYAFVRTTGYLSGPTDVYVSMSMVRKNGLRRGDAITGAVRQPREGEQQRQKFNPLVRVDSINGRDPEAARNRPEFTKLTPLYPNERLRLETDPSQLTTRVIDLIMPVGKGQRALIVSPPKAGKTTIMQNIANAITTNNPECHLMVVLVDERPEEVTDMQRSVKGEVIASTFDRPPADHTAVAELSIERAKRLVEMGHDVVVLLDNITRLGRAYNLAAPASGRILSGGVDSTALYPPKRFLGAARNIEDGGSLTIFATALVETGSTMDTVIFEEFKGTGNAELKLDRKIADKRIFPAIDVGDSSTRKEELLMSPDEHAVMVKLRRVLAALDDQQALDLVLSRLKKTKTNIEFLMQVAKNTPGKDED
ncbi:Transcription termination factor Rho [Pseudonocardia sp. Ae406_Ps2]|uniref:transcription termination factor Rho n=2 Tax=Pseudonocardia TaxID=1847 RepID=UPI00094B57BC|nr:Transcription termination factor Rho [Pseudonocardia sp. Ae331_Ps2]OLM05010.1 Transcription termination factor Rho [Pseudonocardia sp. Ae406_Ps2]OLM26582.1 Transcription termination factor Rho [Pseudonocardia sp. Ae706_Ps2]